MTEEEQILNQQHYDNIDPQWLCICQILVINAPTNKQIVLCRFFFNWCENDTIRGKTTTYTYHFSNIS